MNARTLKAIAFLSTTHSKHAQWALVSRCTHQGGKGLQVGHFQFWYSCCARCYSHSWPHPPNSVHPLYWFTNNRNKSCNFAQKILLLQVNMSVYDINGYTTLAITGFLISICHACRLDDKLFLICAALQKSGVSKIISSKQFMKMQ